LFRTARSEDIDQLHQLLVAEAQEGRFDRRLAEEPYRSAMRRNLNNIRKRGRRLDEDLEAQVLVWEHEGVLAGCVINSAILPGAGNEIWAIAVVPQARGEGFGSAMSARLVDVLHPRVDIYARCAAQAQVACDMFLRRGFLPLDVTEHGVRVLKLPRLGASLATQSAGHQQLEPFVEIPVGKRA
jgi:N-acetylglutamate synthase-like GNAT family acetyltransferase